MMKFVFNEKSRKWQKIKNVRDWVRSFDSSSKDEKGQMIKHYCDELRRRYNIEADPDELLYKHQFCWDITCK